MKHTFFPDLKSSLLVFLIALPLALGIAQASGYPPVAGLITSIIGGLLVGFFGGAPLQVSGATASLTALIFSLASEFGVEKTSLIVVASGMLQVLFGLARTGKYFRAISPTVIQALFCSIGLLIIASQIEVLCDYKPATTLLANLMILPKTFSTSLPWGELGSHNYALLVGLSTLVLIQIWNHLPKRYAFNLPSSLVAIICVTLASSFLSLPVHRINLPSDPFAGLQFINSDTFSMLLTASFWFAAFQIALIASSESILSTVATEQMRPGQRNDCNRELVAQGIGNGLCGLLGALPMAGVIVRSAANVQAGAKTRLSTMLHGLWFILALLAVPGLLNAIPSAALAAVLVHVGWRLLPIKAFVKMAKQAKGECLIFTATVICILSYDMLVGIVIGVFLSVIKQFLMKANKQLQHAPQTQQVLEFRKDA